MNQQVSVSEAAVLVSKSPKTLYADIKKGKLSVTKDLDGQKMVAISELIRVYGEIKQEQPGTTKPENNELLELKHKLELLAQENESLKERLQDKENNLADLRQAITLLEHTPRPNQSFLSRLFRK